MTETVDFSAGVIFDLDGTLWDSSHNVSRSWREQFAARDLDSKLLQAETFQQVMGKTIPEIKKAFQELLCCEDAEKIFDECMEEEIIYLRNHGGILYPELVPTLEILSKKYPLFIVSNCNSGYIEAFLKAHRLQNYFKDIECYGNTHLEKSENIRLIVERNNLQQAIYVGDTEGDRLSAKKAGLPFVHARYGFGTVDSWYAIDRLSELPPLTDDIFGNE